MNVIAVLNSAILIIHAAKSLLHRADYHSLCHQVEAYEGMLLHCLSPSPHRPHLNYIAGRFTNDHSHSLL